MKKFQPKPGPVRKIRVLDPSRSEKTAAPQQDSHPNDYGHRGTYDQVEAARMGYGFFKQGFDPMMGGFANQVPVDHNPWESPERRQPIVHDPLKQETDYDLVTDLQAG